MCVIYFFFREDDLSTCKKSTKNKTKQQQHKSTLQKIDNISLALMKQFNLFPVAREKMFPFILPADNKYSTDKTIL